MPYGPHTFTLTPYPEHISLPHLPSRDHSLTGGGAYARSEASSVGRAQPGRRAALASKHKWRHRAAAGMGGHNFRHGW
jgi:hypothetical protein